MQFGDLIHAVKEFDRIQTRIDRLEEKCAGDTSLLSKAMQSEYKALSDKAQSLREDISAEHEDVIVSKARSEAKLYSYESFKEKHPFAAWLWMWVGGILFVITGYDKKLNK